MERETKGNTMLSENMKVSDLERRERSWHAASRHTQTAGGRRCGQPARLAESGFQACTIYDDVEREEFAAGHPKVNTRNFPIPEGQKSARQRNNAEQAEYRLLCRKRRCGGSTSVAASSRSRSAFLLAANACTERETWLSLEKSQARALHTRASGLPCSALLYARKNELAGRQDVTPTVNTGAVEAKSQIAHKRRWERDDSICRCTEECDPQDPDLPCCSRSVARVVPPQTSHQMHPLLDRQKGSRKANCTCCGTFCINGARLCVTCDRSQRRSTETSSAVHVSERQGEEVTGSHTPRQEAVTPTATKDPPDAASRHVKRTRSCMNMDAYRSAPGRHPPSMTPRTNRTGPGGWTPFPSRQFPLNLHFSQASFISKRVSEQGDGMADAHARFLFVHPYLLLPLLPPASAFTNPCWPPTPPKKRRRLHYSSGTCRGVSAELAGTGAESKTMLISDSTSGNQYRRPLPPGMPGSSSLWASADAVSSSNSSPLAFGLKLPNNMPCKTCAPAAENHQVKVVATTHRSSGREEEGKRTEVFYGRQRTHCHIAGEKHCLIDGGHLFQCACCSPWLPRRAPQLVKAKHARGDMQTGCATVFMHWIHPKGPLRDNRLKKVQDACSSAGASGVGQGVDAAPQSAQGGAHKQFENKLHGTSLLTPERHPVCDLLGGGSVVFASKSPSQLTPAGSGDVQHTRDSAEINVASEMGSALVEWKAKPGRRPPRDNVCDNADSVQERRQMLFEKLPQRKTPQQEKNAFVDSWSLFKTDPPQRKYSASKDFPFSITARMLAPETAGIKGDMREASIQQVKDPHFEVPPQCQRLLLADRSNCLFCAQCRNTSASAGRRCVLCALPARHDRSFNKSPGLGGSLLLPSIGCGLTVAQSSLGRGSGLGLYAVRPFSARSRISEYSGLCVDRKVAMLLRSMGTSTHVMRVGMQHQYLVGYRLPFLYGAAGAFVNDGRWYADGRRGPGVGARFQVVYDKKRARDRVYVVATRDIKAGEEIFTSYDNLYWALME